MAMDEATKRAVGAYETPADSGTIINPHGESFKDTAHSAVIIMALVGGIGGALAGVGFSEGRSGMGLLGLGIAGLSSLIFLYIICGLIGQAVDCLAMIANNQNAAIARKQAAAPKTDQTPQLTRKLGKPEL